VPCSGTFTIESQGISGGHNGGSGAKMKGEFELFNGKILSIVVGQQGLVNSGGWGVCKYSEIDVG